MLSNGKASVELLESLHSAVASDLLRRIQSGEATAADLNAAIKYLKDNNIEATPGPDNDLGQLRDMALPKFDDEEDN